MEDKTKESTAKSPQPPAQAASKAAPHDSNPFTTTLTGVKKLLNFNSGSLVAVILFSIVLGILLLLTFAAMAVAFLAFVITNVPEYSMFYAQAPPALLDLAHSLTGANMYVTFGLGFILFILLVSFGQAMQLKLVTASVASQRIGFSELFKQALRHTLPLIGLGLLSLLVILIVCVVLALLIPLIGMLTIVLALIAFLAVLYIGLRLALAMLAIVEENLSPIAAIKRSWALTRGHVVEVVGIVAVTGIFAGIPSGSFDGLAQLTSGPASTTFQLVGLLIGLVASIIVIAGFAERFEQLGAIAKGSLSASKTHLYNYIAVVILIVASAILNMLFPQPTADQELQQYFQEMKENNGQPAEDSPATDSQEGSEEYYQPDQTEMDSEPPTEYN